MKMDAAAWNLMILVVYAIAVVVDPLFFYLPVINEATKCITIDKTLEIVTNCVRAFLDLVAIGDLVARSDLFKRKKKGDPHDDDRKRPCISEYVINILGILPVPQVLVPMIVSGMRGSKFRNIRKFLSAVVILQYVPRHFRIRRLWKIAVDDYTFMNKSTETESSESGESTEKEKIKKAEKEKIEKKYIAVNAGLNLHLYLIASHVLGAFWYFFSIERETKCWHLACEHDIECIKSGSRSFHCGDVFRNYTILNDYCSLKNPNTTFFDFGIFQKARQSGILDSMDISQKILFCSLWGLRNLSSLGQNLETSIDYWENWFAYIVSIYGLLMFSYFMANLQAYMQSGASSWLEKYNNKRSVHAENGL